MKFINSLILLTICVVIICSDIVKPSIDYVKQTGWPSTCMGKRQSPINISAPYRPSKAVIEILKFAPEPIQKASFGFLPGRNAALVFSQKLGSTVVKVNETIVEYDIIDINFHLKSEHQIESKSADLEMHIIHELNVDKFNQKYGEKTSFDPKFKRLVFAQLFRIEGATNAPELDKFKDKSFANFDLNKLITTDRANFYHYEGSNTIPPCEENYLWVVMEKVKPMSSQQHIFFHNVFLQNGYQNGNQRIPQPRYDRAIYKSAGLSAKLK